MTITSNVVTAKCTQWKNELCAVNHWLIFKKNSICHPCCQRQANHPTDERDCHNQLCLKASSPNAQQMQSKPSIVIICVAHVTTSVRFSLVWKWELKNRFLTGNFHCFLISLFHKVMKSNWKTVNACSLTMANSVALLQQAWMCWGNPLVLLMKELSIWLTPTFSVWQLQSGIIRCIIIFLSTPSSNCMSSLSLGNWPCVIRIPCSDNCLNDVACVLNAIALHDSSWVASLRMGSLWEDWIRKSVEVKLKLTNAGIQRYTHFDPTCQPGPILLCHNLAFKIRPKYGFGAFPPFFLLPSFLQYFWTNPISAYVFQSKKFKTKFIIISFIEFHCLTDCFTDIAICFTNNTQIFDSNFEYCIGEIYFIHNWIRSCSLIQEILSNYLKIILLSNYLTWSNYLTSI